MLSYKNEVNTEKGYRIQKKKKSDDKQNFFVENLSPTAWI